MMCSHARTPPRPVSVRLPAMILRSESESCSVDHSGEDVRIARVLDGEHADTVHSLDSSAELDVVSVEVEHLGATKDSHVLELRLSDSGAVVGNDDQLGLSISQTFHDGLETDFVLARLDSKRQLLVSVLRGLALLSHF